MAKKAKKAKKTEPKTKKVKEKNSVKNVQSKKSPVKAGELATIVAGTLKRHSFGEYKLPGVLVRYLTGPKAKLGLHFEYYVSELNPPSYYDPDDKEVENLFLEYAWKVVSEVAVNKYPIQEKTMKPYFCEKHDE